jgi:putative transposase
MRILCRVLKVSSNGYYAWRNRKPSRRDFEDEQLRPKVVEAFRIGRGTYGSPRVLVELVEQGLEVGRRRIARLMAGTTTRETNGVAKPTDLGRYAKSRAG